MFCLLLLNVSSLKKAAQRPGVWAEAQGLEKAPFVRLLPAWAGALPDASSPCPRPFHGGQAALVFSLQDVLCQVPSLPLQAFPRGAHQHRRHEWRAAAGQRPRLGHEQEDSLLQPARGPRGPGAGKAAFPAWAESDEHEQHRAASWKVRRVRWYTPPLLLAPSCGAWHSNSLHVDSSGSLL